MSVPKLYYHEIRPGCGTMKYYSYWVPGINLKRKTDVQNALDLKMNVMRKDKLDGTIQEFNYKTGFFTKVKA